MLGRLDGLNGICGHTPTRCRTRFAFSIFHFQFSIGFPFRPEKWKIENGKLKMENPPAPRFADFQRLIPERSFFSTSRLPKWFASR
jgi:hypothetical protein